MVGRLGPDQGVAAARAEAGAIAASLRRRRPETHRDRDFVTLPAGRVRILPGVDGTLRAASAAAMAVVGLVLLLASANLANLLLARAAGRRREIATRLSLGASAGAVIRQLLTESLLLALAGGGLGLLLALGSNRLLGALRLPVPEAPRVAVVNETLAELLWPASASDSEAPGQQALGRRLRAAGVEGTWEVVGVVGTGKYRTLGEAPRPFLYRALAQNRWRPGGAAGVIHTGLETLVARVEGEPSAALAAIRLRVRSLDENLALSRLATLEAALGPTLWLPRMGALLFGLFGAVGLALAAAGIYGVMACTASRRILEIGIRLALGARRRDVVLLIGRRALTLTALGLILGLTGAAAAAGGLRAMLYGVGTVDVLTFAAVSLLLAAVALLAGYLPARRAARADPAKALRCD